MKSIIYIIITVFIFSILISALPGTNSESGERLTLECVSDNYSIGLLRKSADVLAARLNDYGIQNSKFFINEQLSSIDISLNKDVNLSEVISLLKSKGRVEFFETFDRKEVINNLGINKELALILNVSIDSKEFADNLGVYGYCKESNREKVELFIENHYVSKPGKGINFYWSEQPNSKGDFYLYLLQSHALLDNSFISESAVKTDLPNETPELNITFDNAGKSIWKDVTKRNIGKSIAIVLDKKVLYTPVVQSEIQEGKCIITGNFSLNEISRINSLINNSELPLEFEIKN